MLFILLPGAHELKPAGASKGIQKANPEVGGERNLEKPGCSQ